MAVATAFLWAGPAQTQEDGNSGNFLLPFCKAWLHIVSRDPNLIKNEIAAGNASPGGLQMYFLKAGMCAGEVVGIVQMLRLLKGNNPSPMVCVPDEATKEQSVRAVVNSLEQHPEVLHEDFSTLVVAVTSVTWPCHK
jgi:hypothetical protein